MADFSHIVVKPFTGIEIRIQNGEYVDGPEIAQALRDHGAHPLPAAVLTYLCRYLEGNVQKPKGRKGPSTVDALAHIRLDMIIRGTYRNYLQRLTYRRNQYGKPAGWTTLAGTPAEIAARIVAKRYLYGEHSWRSVQNIASSRR